MKTLRARLERERQLPVDDALRIAREVGDADAEFSIQSISKPFVLALALQRHGRDAVLAKVGAEPSGEPFNAISL